MDRQTRKAIDRHIEGPSWAQEGDGDEVDPGYDEHGNDIHMKVTKSILFKHDDTMTLADLERVVATSQKVVNNKARVTVHRTPADRPGAPTFIEFRVTEQ